jgi:hypothetical protein
MSFFTRLFDKQNNTTKWNTCENPQFGFQFRYPQGWKNVPGIPSIVYHPADAKSFIASNKEKVFSPGITLVMMPRGNTAGQTPAQAFEGFKRLLPNFFPDYTCLSEKETRLASGQDAHQISFTFRKADRPFRSVLKYVVLHNFIFIFDGSALTEHFLSHEKILSESLSSLKIQ